MGDIFVLQSRPVTPSIHLSEKAEPLLQFKDIMNDIVKAINNYLTGRKILHLGSLAGWPYTIAKAMRENGVDSENVIHCYKDVAGLERKLPFDKSIYKTGDSPVVKAKKTWDFFKGAKEKYGLIHYHSSNIFPREIHWLLEGPWFKAAKIPMVLSLGGGDARFISKTRRLNKFFYREPNIIKDIDTYIRWLSWRQNIDLCATDPEMILFSRKYIDKNHLFRQPIDFTRLPTRKKNERNHLRFLHVPTEPWVKGTDIINLTMERFKNQGYSFEYESVRNLEQDKFYEKLNNCDVYIDELKCGSHGVTAVEAMALGKAVITYIREDLLPTYPRDLPIINSNPTDFFMTIQSILSGRIDVVDVGERSFVYAKTMHDSRIVANDLLRAYVDIFK
jgi:hypothetical protein